MWQEGKPFSDITAKLNVSTSSVLHNLQKLSHLQDFYASTSCSSCPHVLTDDELQKIQQGIESGDCPDTSATHHALIPHVDVTTVCRALCKMGLYGCHHCTVPVLTAKHASQHLKWALKQ